MRLTLRTLLAYMDDFLEPEDREDIAQKLGGNEQAAALVHRIRDVTGRMRLGAPQVIGNGMGRDPNSVAEYLESTLAPEQVLLIERVCLESDVHLAEVGAVHHIVTMILSEPAQVDPASRQRIYGLIDQVPSHEIDVPTAAAVAASVPVEVVASPNGAAAASPLSAKPEDADGATRRKPEVPEYLRASSGVGWKPIALTLVGAALATAVVLGIMYPDRVLGPLGLRKPSGTATPNGPQARKTQDDKTAGNELKPKPLGDNMPVPIPGSVPGGVKNPTKNPETSQKPDVATVVPPIDKTPMDKAPEGTPKTLVDKPPVSTLPKQPDKGAPPAKVPDHSKIIAVPVPVNPPDGSATPATPVAPPAPGPERKKPDEVARLDPKLVAVKPGPEAAAPVPIGRILSQDQILLRFKQQGDRWERLPASAPVFAGDRLLALPAFRPLINVGGVSLQLDGPTELQLGTTGTDGVPHVAVAYGRLVVRSLGQPNSRLGINTGSGEGTVTFRDTEATVGLQARLVHPPGADPEKVASIRHVDLYATSGKVDWTAGGAPILLASPQHLILTDGVAQPSPDPIPAWIAASQVSSLDARAAQRIHEGMPADRSINLSLSELLRQPRIEVRSLAARSSAFVGLFDPLVAGLADEDQRAGWAMLVSELQAAVARDPQTAAAVREAFVQRRREKAPELYRMLWGYTPAGLKNGDARRLVDTLDHQDLDFRVLSFMNLQEITGMGLYYRPEYNASKRKTSIIRWQKRLDEGKIAYANGAASAPLKPAPAVTPAAPPAVAPTPAAPGPAPPLEAIP